MVVVLGAWRLGKRGGGGGHGQLWTAWATIVQDVSLAYIYGIAIDQ